MANNKDIVKLAIDSYKGKVAGNYSTNDSMEVLRKQSLIIKLSVMVNVLGFSLL